MFQAPNVGVAGKDHGNRRKKYPYIIQFFDIKTKELLAEEEITESSEENVGQYAENYIKDFFNIEDVYFTFHWYKII